MSIAQFCQLQIMILESLHTVDDIKTSQAAEYGLLKSFFKKHYLSFKKQVGNVYFGELGCPVSWRSAKDHEAAQAMKAAEVPSPQSRRAATWYFCVGFGFGLVKVSAGLQFGWRKQHYSVLKRGPWLFPPAKKPEL